MHKCKFGTSFSVESSWIIGSRHFLASVINSYAQLPTFSILFKPDNSSMESNLTEVSHYGDVIMGAISSQITSLTIVYSTVYSNADQRKKIKAPRHWPLCGEFTGDRWISSTNGQLRGKCFHFMTSSCFRYWKFHILVHKEIVELFLNRKLFISLGNIRVFLLLVPYNHFHCPTLKFDIEIRTSYTVRQRRDYHVLQENFRVYITCISLKWSVSLRCNREYKQCIIMHL